MRKGVVVPVVEATERDGAFTTAVRSSNAGSYGVLLVCRLKFDVARETVKTLKEKEPSF